MARHDYFVFESAVKRLFGVLIGHGIPRRFALLQEGCRAFLRLTLLAEMGMFLNKLIEIGIAHCGLRLLQRANLRGSR